MVGLKKGEIIGGWRKLHSEELQNVYSSSNFIRLITSRRIRWVGSVARIEEEECIQGFRENSRKKETTRNT
jgi:hypothetical protein